ncbi:Putative ribose-phosphate pyrophosphokinase [Streptomyces hirsutus]
MCDAARGASASRITVVMPHYSYARSDKKDAPRISMGGRLVADLLVAAGASRVLAMTLHGSHGHGFFSVPVDHLHALRELASHFRQYDLSRTTVVSPDLGNAKEAAAFARLIGAQVAAGAERRRRPGRARRGAARRGARPGRARRRRAGAGDGGGHGAGPGGEGGGRGVPRRGVGGFAEGRRAAGAAAGERRLGTSSLGVTEPSLPPPHELDPFVVGTDKLLVGAAS